MDSKRHENKRRKEKENSSKDSESKGEKRRVLRHEWSQTRSEVSATLDVGFPVDSNQVTLKCTDAECSITLPDGRHWDCELFAPVVGEYTSLIHKPKKVVVKMVKKDPSINWCQLEKSDEPLRPDVPTQDDKEENPTTELTNPKYDYYESGANGDTVTVTLFVKSISKETLNVEFHDAGFSVRFRTKNTNSEFLELHKATEETTFVWRVNVKEPIRAAECRHRLSPCKLELILKKVVPAKWSCLELPVKKEPMAAPSNTWMPVSRSASLAAPPPEASTPIPLAAAPERAGCSEPPTLDSSAGDASSLHAPTLKQEEAKKKTYVVPTQRTPPDGGAERSPAVLEPEVALGYTGLDNLGNTCFMNSVLQCLANTREFRDYFLGGVFQGEINTENPLGMRGELAVAFAVLLRWLWSGAQRSYAPSRLKSLISVKAPQFTGFAQHDAQEFMAFLLDGLHEDLNRIHNKPYVESVDSANRPDEVVAEESWSRYKLRNDSIVVDLFQGQYKSTVICPECQKVSINFDPFLYLSVPLPKKQKIFVVHFYRWDPDQVPIKLCLRLNQDARVEDLKDEIFKKTHVLPKNLRVLEVYNRKIYKVFNRDDDSLMDITPKDLIFAFEILDRDKAREKVIEVAVVQRLLMPHAATTCASCGVAKLEALKRCTRCLRVGYCNRTCQTNHWHQHKSVCKFVPELIGLPFVLSLPQSQATYANLCRLMEAYSRHSVNVFQPPVKSNKCALDAAAGTPPGSVEPLEAELDEAEGLDPGSNEGGPMFGVTSVVPYAESCPSKVDFVFEDRGNEPLDLSRVYYLAMDWRNNQRQGSYVLVESKEVDYATMDDDCNLPFSEEDGISLDQCLTLFTEPEVLSPQEAWYCPGCKEHRQATKELSLWRLPPVLIIQLKRFSFTRSIFRDKIDKMVDFPINGLDVSPYYCGPACESGGPQPVYDLFAVINHHGGMLGGHYTAFGRCTDATDTRLSEVGWRLFDDSRVNAVSDVRVATSAAYMLFYRRRNTPFELSSCGASMWRPKAATAPSQKLLKDRENLLDQEFSAQNDANNNRCHYGVATPDDASVDMDSPD
ncbi:ubiquitin carboxyl-terminal hydrolase 19 isoform X1 [Ixodes scapularis]|uniref:ubiquitin carboxyl-terminal hydrolase 19 isoform X1 n=1 Tax=Ixodes scapularis TaxID=6945 RepID=UPI001C3814C2|nr:ubiquitin carboxyl-terminal hydrolase 19 isoform X1 [Ixodes scapularis]